MWKKLIKNLHTGCVYLIFLAIAGSPVLADRMGSTNYNLIFTNINMGGETTSSTNYTLDISLGQMAAKRWAENGYIVRAGFQYIHILYPFSFELSDTTLDFETLIPNIPSTKSLTATVYNRGQGYEVKVYEDHPLETFDGGNEIVDTSCDDPFCSTTNAEAWVQNSTYGFGYNAMDDDVSTDFVDATYFRPFSLTPVTFMSSNEAAVNRQSTVTAKVNIDGTQPAGTYQTVLRFIAVPKY